MHMIVTGASGFIGRAVVRVAQARGHAVTAVGRYDDVTKLLRGDDRLIHLAWQDVEKYTGPQSLFRNLEPQFLFLKMMLDAGLRRITVAGSCLEYGLVEGMLSEDMPCDPVTYYGLAKLTLYRMLTLAGGGDIQLNWLRYFYVHGPGQRPQALLPQLQSAIDRGDKVFNMSPGDQSRDFIHVDTVAHNTVLAAEQPRGLGIVNVGSGQPLRVIDLVREVLKRRNSAMEINAGFYPYPAYEPYAFWANTNKLKAVPGMNVDQKVVL